MQYLHVLVVYFLRYFDTIHFELELCIAKKKCRYLTLDNFIISGHTVDEVLFRTHVPKQFSAPNLPELNRSQVHAVRHALQRPLSLIQGKNLSQPPALLSIFYVSVQGTYFYQVIFGTKFEIF